MWVTPMRAGARPGACYKLGIAMCDQDRYELRMVHCPECKYQVSHRVATVRAADMDCPRCHGHKLGAFLDERLPSVVRDEGERLHGLA